MDPIDDQGIKRNLFRDRFKQVRNVIRVIYIICNRMHKFLIISNCNYVTTCSPVQRYLYFYMLFCNCDLQGQGHGLKVLKFLSKDNIHYVFMVQVSDIDTLKYYTVTMTLKEGHSLVSNERLYTPYL